MSLMTDDSLGSQLIDLGWRYNPLEHRNAHGEWSRDGSTVMGTLSGMKWGSGERYKEPPVDRVAANKAKASDNAFIKKYGLSSKNIVAAFDDANTDERDQGMRWYSDAHTVARMIGGGDADKGAALLACYSPQTDWQTNALNAAHALELGHSPEHGTGITGAVKTKANAILGRDHGPYDDLFPTGAPKTHAFYQLIRNGGDTPDDTEGLVVMDRHALSVAAGRRLTKDQTDTPSYADVRAEHPDWNEDQVKAYRSELPAAPVGSTYTYQYMADMYRKAALDISRRDGIDIAPHQVQAITWLRQQRKNNELDAALVAQAEELVKQGRKLSEVAGAKEAKGRFSRASRAWDTWEQHAIGHTIATHKGTTAVVHENPISFSGSLGEQIELAFNPMQARDSRGRWTKFGGASDAVKVMEKDREGFSVSPLTGGQPVHGYMVALDGHTHRYPASILDDRAKLRRAIDDMLMSERSSFEGKDMYIGGWVEDGHLWLDPSQNVQDRAEAERLGKERDQVGIFDLNTFSTINTGGSGGGRIIDHNLAWRSSEGSRLGAGGVLGLAGGGAAGGSRQDGRAAPGSPGEQPGSLGEQIELSRFGSDLAFLGHFHLKRGKHGEFERAGGSMPSMEGPLPARTRKSTFKTLDEVRQSRREYHPLNSVRSQATPDRGGPKAATPHIRAAMRASMEGKTKTPGRSAEDIARTSGVSPGSFKASSTGLEDATRDFSQGVKAFAASMNLSDAQNRQLSDLLSRQDELNKSLAEAVLAVQTASSLSQQATRRNERLAKMESLRAQKAEQAETERAKEAEKRLAASEKISELISERNSNFRIALGTSLGGLAGFLAFRYGVHTGGEAISGKDLWEVVVPMIAATVGAAGPAFIDMIAKTRRAIATKAQSIKDHAADEDYSRALREVTRGVAQAAMEVLGLNEIEAAQFARLAMSAA